MKNNIEYSLPRKKQKVYGFVKKILRLFYKKPQVISLAGEIEDKSILVANHVAKRGPVVYDLYLPKKYTVKWGAHQMVGNYKSRKAYLRDVFYITKQGYGKFHASLAGGFEAIFSKYFYRGIKVIGTYENVKLRRTINKSIDVINENIPILIFPENSWEGYKEVLTEFYPGFVLLAEQYFKRTGVDLPVYPVYYHAQKKIMLIDRPLYVNELAKQGLDKKQIAEVFKNKVNDLHDMIVQDKIPQAQ